ncbi:HAD family hydrolase [Streptomyces sp. NPDC059785]|uniref:HAD family hydrolase n=1 Tax=Streptomyces sp. NPDC059785 TaxID=3346945 RepID=UPI003654D981
MTDAFSDVEAVLFDVDDTLVDTYGVWTRALDTVCLDFASRVPGADAHVLAATYRVTSDALWTDYERTLAPFGSVPAMRRHVWRRTLTDCGVEPTDDSLDRIIAQFDAQQRAGIRPDPELPRLIGRLAHRYRLAVCSNGEGTQTRTKLERAGLLQHFELIVCGMDEHVRKPDPELFRRCCRALGIPPQHCLYIGDDWRNDVDAARRAGLRPLWIPTDPAAAVPEGEQSPPRFPTIALCLRHLLHGTTEPSVLSARGADRHPQEETS